MTGEITLTGRVLAIGGLKEKSLAAHRAGMKYIIAPLANKPDWAELSRPARAELEFIWVETMDQVVNVVLREVEASAVVPTVPEAIRTGPEKAAHEEREGGSPRRRKHHNPPPATQPNA